jgi:cell division protein FtsQ
MTRLPTAFWIGLGFFVCVILLVVVSVVKFSQKMKAEQYVPITSIIIEGEMPYTTKKEVYKALEYVKLSNFFTVDVNQVRQQIAKLPWVYSVAVRKQWPEQLKLYIVDQKPVALWNGDFVLNQEGKAFQADTNRIQHPLPKFFGPEGSEAVVLENYQHISQLLAFGKLAISELILSERYAWQVTLTNGVLINLGQEKRFVRIQRFLDIYSKIQQAKPQQQIDYIDLRYDVGVAVGWKTAPEEKRA